MKKQNEDKYLPYTKNDFRTYWLDRDNGAIKTISIIRPLTEDEKKNFDKGNDYTEEMYLIKDSENEEWEVFDTEILKECELDSRDWYQGLMQIIESLEYDEDGMKEFIKLCKIEQYIKKNC